MSCCKHPLVSLAEQRQQAKLAAKLEKYLNSDETLAFDTKRDNITNIVLEHLEVSPKVAGVITTHLLEILGSVLPEHRKFSQALVILVRNLTQEPSLHKHLGEVVDQLPKLKACWKDIKNIAYETTKEQIK